MTSYNLSHLRQLEAESIHIMREVVAECENPVMLYSVGKDSSVLVRLAQKAFAPGPIPFPLLHIDTTFKFREMIEFRDRFCREIGARLIVKTNHEALARIGPPEKWDCTLCADLLKTQALVRALQEGGYDAAFGGARRDEEKSRAKERVLSFRDKFQQWDPKNQRPELWNLYNTRHGKDESFRVFPLSNWTELDVWHYIYAEQIPIPPLYFAKARPVVRRDGMLLLAGELIQPLPGEKVETAMVRFRTLGCQLCTGAVESDATTLEQIIEETMLARKSERENRAVDQDREGSMEEKKKEGYF
ncbi:MAG: sulfate adenylyltransferase subunit CysD [Acidobacteriota bacterium]|nr:sulfate adenylyltransferase subunit CysD [Acidobacteriota bacterium]MDQ7086458.1 sulfate adenylyltransferase subunit CysD [Acidobacteriota bacterium]